MSSACARSHDDPAGKRRLEISFFIAATDDAQSVEIKDDLAFFALGRQGLAIYSIAQALSPQPLSQLAFPDLKQIRLGASGRAFAIDRQQGLVVVDAADPTHPKVDQQLALVQVQDSVRDVLSMQTEDRDVLFFAGGIGGLGGVAFTGGNASLVDISSQTSNGVYLGQSGSDTLLVSEFGYGLGLYDVANLSAPHRIGAYNGATDIRRFQVSDGLAYLASLRGGMQIIDVHDPAKPTLLGRFQPAGLVQDVVVSGSRALVIANSGSEHFSIHLLDVATPNEPKLLESFDGEGQALAIKVAGTHFYLAISKAIGSQGGIAVGNWEGL